jgi:hypothetical protein
MEDKDITRLWMLLEIVHKAAASGPAYGWIIPVANAEIVKYKPVVAAPAPPPAPVTVNTDGSMDFQTFNRKLSSVPSPMAADNDGALE